MSPFSMELGQQLQGMVEIGASEVDTLDKLKDQILRMDRYNRRDRELGVGGPAAAQNQTPHQAPKQKPQQLPHQQKNAGGNGGTKFVSPERAVAVAAKKLDKQQGNCYNCHRPDHLEKDCLKKTIQPASSTGKKQATYTNRVRKGRAKPDVQSSSDSEAADDVQSGSDHTATCDDTLGKPCAEDFLVNACADAISDDYSVWEWCFDNAANVHMASDRRYFTDYEPFGQDTECVRGFKKKFAAAPIGHGTVQVVVKKGDLDVVLTLQDALHVPNSKNLLSHSQAEDQVRRGG
ncbi:hypothetical protein PHYSODRAFT_257313 [Phytophthora sojae]|uniref:CCHC-type domain-containing protein n=1 Tax=Phytophthora sojae (strain P6497) TaxID=1094619 RepID=G4YJW7_PHYSP|nr:hypothetical protein PHYSODRAFT_257313 [Phytophthora sojae]EGZ27099.1 hypothetical protein PHYSODRAFT_257313 [Phytophthora sojae]|eukprot:XP_009514374.1 hypothetical protein PHYSODRAFT_257313 [Phytophthora sojae]